MKFDEGAVGVDDGQGGRVGRIVGVGVEDPRTDQRMDTFGDRGAVLGGGATSEGDHAEQDDGDERKGERDTSHRYPPLQCRSHRWQPRRRIKRRDCASRGRRPHG